MDASEDDYRQPLHVRQRHIIRLYRDVIKKFVLSGKLSLPDSELNKLELLDEVNEMRGKAGSAYKIRRSQSTPGRVETTVFQEEEDDDDDAESLASSAPVSTSQPQRSNSCPPTLRNLLPSSKLASQDANDRHGSDTVILVRLRSAGKDIQLNFAKGRSHAISAQVIINGELRPIYPRQPPFHDNNGISLDLAIRSEQLGPMIELGFTLSRPHMPVKKYLHIGSVNFPIGKINIPDTSSQSKVSYPLKCAISKPTFKYGNETKTSCTFTFTSGFGVGRDLQPGDMFPHEKFVVQYLQSLCHASSQRKVEVRLHCPKPDDSETPTDIELFQKKVQEMIDRKVFTEYYMSQYRLGNGFVNAEGPHIPSEMTILRGNGYMALPKTLQFIGPSHAEIILGYSVALNQAETRHAYRSISDNNHHVQVFLVGRRIFIAVTWRVPLSMGPDRLQLQEGDEVEVTIQAAGELLSTALVTDAHVVSNSFGLPGDVILLPTTNSAAYFRNVRVTFEQYKNLSAPKYLASLKATPNGATSAAMLEAVSKTYHYKRTDGTQGKLLPMLLSQAHDKKSSKHPFADILSDELRAQFDKSFRHFKDDPAENFTPSQKKGFERTLEPENGIVIIDGVGGSGKSTWMHKLIDRFLSSPAKVKAVVTSHKNSVLDMNALALQEAFGDKYMIIRASTVSTEGVHNIVKDRNAMPSEEVNAPEDPSELAVFLIAEQAKADFSTNSRKIADLSVESYVHKLAKNPDSPPFMKQFTQRFGGEDIPSGPEVDMVAHLRNALPKMFGHRLSEMDVNGEAVFDETERNHINQAYRNLRDLVLSHGDIIVGTPTTLKHRVYSHFARDADGVLLCIDEAPSMSEPASLIPLACAKWSHKIIQTVFVGDMRQLGPLALTLGCNQFSNQQSVSLVERLALGGGYTVVKFNEQKRIHEDIFKIVSDVFYGGLVLTNAPDTKLDQKLMDTFKACMDIDKDEQIAATAPRFAWVQVNNGVLRKSSRTTSKANLEIVSVVTAMFPHLTALYGAQTSEKVAVIVSYKRQKELYKAALFRMMRDTGLTQKHYPEIWTIDGSQGREKNLVLADLVVTEIGDGLGFLKDERRLTVAFTRAKMALWVFSGPLSGSSTKNSPPLLLVRQKLVELGRVYYNNEPAIKEGIPIDLMTEREKAMCSLTNFVA